MTTSDDDDFQKYAKLLTEKQRQQEQNDWNNETAERGELGRIHRHYQKDNGYSKTEKKRKERKEFSELLRRLQDPEYAKAYNKLAKTLHSLEKVTAKAMSEVEQRITRQHEAIRQAESTATRLYNGHIVFKDDDGSVKNSKGNFITDPVLLESIVWKPDALTYKEYQALKDGLKASHQELEELQDYQINILGETRHRMADEENPMTTKDILQAQQQVLQQIPASIKAKLQPEHIETHAPQQPHMEISKPVL